MAGAERFATQDSTEYRAIGKMSSVYSFYQYSCCYLLLSFWSV